jgi:imidazolonepropionase-like amidohydrolase
VLAARRQSAIEIRRMISHGLSVTEALVSATAGGAPALGLDAHVGSVEPGERADLLVLDGDPLTRQELLAGANTYGLSASTARWPAQHSRAHVRRGPVLRRFEV